MKDRLSPLTLNAVAAETIRAHVIHQSKSLLNPAMPTAEKLAALVEEVGEVAHALTYDEQLRQGDSAKDNLEKELIQVASVALSWVESLNPNS